MRFFLEGDTRRGLLGLAGGGGVQGRLELSASLQGDFLRGGELDVLCQYVWALDHLGTFSLFQDSIIVCRRRA